MKKVNTKVKNQLIKNLPEYKDKITDLNSIIMGVPSDVDYKY